MTRKTEILSFRVLESERWRLDSILPALGLSEAEYLRGALAARLRRDERKLKEGRIGG